MSMADRDGKIWFDGQLVEWRDARIHVLTHSLHYGLSVFEGVRAYHTDQGTAIFRLPGIAIIGGALIVLGVIVSELKPSQWRRRKR